MRLSFIFSCLFFVVAGFSNGWGQDQSFPLTASPHFLLIDSQSNTYVPNMRISADDYFIPGSWVIEKTVLHGGKQEGVDVIYVDNGKTRFTIVPTRGMSIWEVHAGDVRLGWDSPVSEIVHPQFVDLESRNGIGWLDGFGGWFVRCGLEFAGLPGIDETVDNTGAVNQTPLTLHGKIDYLPASRVEVYIDAAPPHAIHVVGVVNEKMMFGPNLQLVTEFTTEPGSLAFKVSDTVTNLGSKDAETMMIYHPNFGSPLLGEGSQLVAAVERVTPRDDRAAEAEPEGIFHYAGPTPGYVEQVYFLKPIKDDNGKANVLLHTKSGERGVNMKFSAGTLPYLSLWKNTAGAGDGYVTGIEPGTGYPNNRKIERKNGHVPVLKPKGNIRYDLEFEIALDKDRVDAISTEIQELQRGTKPAFDKKPVEGISH